jgi:hypothetical protein
MSCLVDVDEVEFCGQLSWLAECAVEVPSWDGDVNSSSDRIRRHRRHRRYRICVNRGEDARAMTQPRLARWIFQVIWDHGWALMILKFSRDSVSKVSHLETEFSNSVGHVM